MFSAWQSTGEVSLDAKFEEPPPVQDVVVDMAKGYFDALIDMSSEVTLKDHIALVESLEWVI